MSETNSVREAGPGTGLDAQAALIYTMMLASKAESDISDAELSTMARIVEHLPVFHGFDASRLPELGEACVRLLRHEEGLERLITRITDALSPPLRETAYALACDVIAADWHAGQGELRLLEMLRDAFELPALSSAAIEHGARVRHRLLG